MGLFGRKRDSIPDGVRSQARILEMAPTPKAARQSGKRDVEFRFRLSVLTAGNPAEVEHVCVVPHEKMPTLGLTIPVDVAPTDPARLRIAFEDMTDLADRARASAAAAAAGDQAGAAEALGYKLRDD